MIAKLINEQTVSFPFEETFTTPGASKGYMHRLQYVPDQTQSPVVSFTGVPSSAGSYTLVPYVPTTSGEVYLDIPSNSLLFHNSDGDLPALVVNYHGTASPVNADDLNERTLWLSRSLHIVGIPQYQNVVEDGGTWLWSFPQFSFYFGGDSDPLTRLHDTVRIKRLTLHAQDLSAITAHADYETRIGVSTVLKGRPNDFDSEGFLGNQYIEGDTGCSVALNSAGWMGGGAVQETWFRNSVECDLELDLTDGPVWLNVFTLDNRANHANLTLEVLAY